jgi:hypothetical protein
MLLEPGRNVANRVVPPVGRLAEVDDPVQPYRVTDRDGQEIAAVSNFLQDLRARDLSMETLKSCGRPCCAGSASCGPLSARGSEPAGRRSGTSCCGSSGPTRRRRPDAPRPGSVNTTTGKRYTGTGFAPRTIDGCRNRSER